jgi:hypothetical protein
MVPIKRLWMQQMAMELGAFTTQGHLKNLDVIDSTSMKGIQGILNKQQSAQEN